MPDIHRIRGNSLAAYPTERQLEAFRTGDRSMLLWSVLDSHQTRSYDQAVAVLEDLLAADGNEEMNTFFKFPPSW